MRFINRKESKKLLDLADIVSNREYKVIPMNKSTSLCNEDIVQQMARIHPMKLSEFLSATYALLKTQACSTPEHPALHQLANIRTSSDLALVNWKAFDASLCQQTDIPVCSTIVEHIGLFAERIILHHQLYCSLSASTLRLLNRCKLPPSPLPYELALVYNEFEQFHALADNALQKGRGQLQAFQDLAQEGASLSCLQMVLDQARRCYRSYCQALQQADELVGYIYWYLSWDAGGGHRMPFHAA